MTSVVGANDVPGGITFVKNVVPRIFLFRLTTLLTRPPKALAPNGGSTDAARVRKDYNMILQGRMSLNSPLIRTNVRDVKRYARSKIMKQMLCDLQLDDIQSRSTHPIAPIGAGLSMELDEAGRKATVQYHIKLQYKDCVGRRAAMKCTMSLQCQAYVWRVTQASSRNTAGDSPARRRAHPGRRSPSFAVRPRPPGSTEGSSAKRCVGKLCLQNIATFDAPRRGGGLTPGLPPVNVFGTSPCSSRNIMEY